MRNFILIATALLALSSSAMAADPQNGDSVLAYFKAAEHYFAATVVEPDAAAKGSFKVVFEDGDIASVTAAQIRPLEIKEGTKVSARWKDGKFYPGVVEKVVGRALSIKYDDGDKGWAALGNVAVK